MLKFKSGFENFSVWLYPTWSYLESDEKTI